MNERGENLIELSFEAIIDASIDFVIEEERLPIIDACPDSVIAFDAMSLMNPPCSATAKPFFSIPSTIGVNSKVLSALNFPSPFFLKSNLKPSVSFSPCYVSINFMAVVRGPSHTATFLL